MRHNGSSYRFLEEITVLDKWIRYFKDPKHYALLATVVPVIIILLVALVAFLVFIVITKR